MPFNNENDIILPDKDFSPIKISSKSTENSAFDEALETYYSGNYSSALSQFLALAGSATAQSENISMYIGSCYFKMQDYEKAEATWKNALRTSPNSAKVFINLANLFFVKKEIEKAILYWHKALTIEPESSIANYNIAVAYSKKSIRELAIRYYERYLTFYTGDKKDPKYEQVKNFITTIKNNAKNLAETACNFFKAKNLDKGVEYYLRAATNYPWDIELNYYIGKMFYKLKHYNRAAEFWLHAYRVDPQKNFALLNIAIAFQKLGYYNYAFSFFKRLLSNIDPKHEKYNFVIKQIKEIYDKIDYSDKGIYHHLENAQNFENECHFQKAMEEYENFLYITNKPDEDIINNISNLKNLIFPELKVLAGLSKQMDLYLLHKRDDLLIQTCNRIILLAPEYSRETINAKKKKLEAQSRLDGKKIEYDKLIQGI